MNHIHLSVFVISFLFAHGRDYGNTYDLYVKDVPNNNAYESNIGGLGTTGDLDGGMLTAPPGYKYVPMSEILANYDPKTYRIMSYGKAVYGLDDGGLSRKKRSFWSFSNPFGVPTADVDGDVKVKTAAAPADTTTTGDVPAVEDSMAAADHDVHDEHRTAAAAGKVEAPLVNIVDIGGDVENSLVVSAPYLPVVQKVIKFVMPGMSSYDVLMLSVNVATVTEQVVQEYYEHRDEGVLEATADAAEKLVTDTLLTKRDTVATVREYATNIYDTIKGIFKSRFGSLKDTDSSPEKDIIEEISEFGIPDMQNNIQKVHTVVKTKLVNGVGIPETETIVTENGSVLKHQITNNKLISTTPIEGNFRRSLENKISDMKNKINNSESMNSSGNNVSAESNENDESNSSGFGDDTKDKKDSDDSDDSENSYESVEFNQEMFDKVLEEVMKLQPEEIQNKSDEELVKYIENYETHFHANPGFDPTNVFSIIINSKKFEDNVTEEQKEKLVTMLGKTTNYFIDKNLEKNMPSLGN